MDLLMPGKMALGAADELNVLMAIHDFPDRHGFGAMRLPDIDREYQGVATRLVVEHDLDRRVGVDAAVPIRLPIATEGGKGGRQRARSHDVLDPDRHVAAVEILHIAASDVDGADGEASVP